MIIIWRYSVISFAALLVAAQICLADEGSDSQSDVTAVEAEANSPSSPADEQKQYAITPEQQQTLEYYQQLVTELESSGGVYDTQISEVLLSLGTTYQTMGRHAEAADFFQRSLHITRVNAGLYSLDQLTMLEKLIESNGKLKDWEALNLNYHNLYWISKRHYGENNPEMLALIDRIGRWHLQAYELDPGSASFSHLLDAEHLYNKSVAIIENQNGKHDLRLINALYGIALTNYQIAAQVSSVENFDDIRAGFRDSSQARRKLQEQRARQDLIMRSFTKGRDAMHHVVAIHANNPILPVDTHAMAMTHLGDWFLLFNKRNSAAETYDQAYQLMADDGMAQQKIDRVFGRPRTLPAIRLPIHNREDLVPENPSYVLASFDVSPSGRATNIKIVESNPVDDVSYLRRAKRSIAATKFRPRYENGKPVSTLGVSLRYVFTD